MEITEIKKEEKNIPQQKYNGFANAAFVLGIIGIILSADCAIAAIVFGKLGMKFSPKLGGYEKARKGFIMGIVGIVVQTVLMILFYSLYYIYLSKLLNFIVGL